MLRVVVVDSASWMSWGTPISEATKIIKQQEIEDNISYTYNIHVYII